MGAVPNVKIDTGTRAGFWRPGEPGGPFIHLGDYIGPPLGDPIIGTKFQQELMEGTITFSVAVLFRPDLGRKNRFLEPIIILDDIIPEIWNYEHWRELGEDA